VGGTIGILGGGQLGRMMAIAGREMGFRTVVWDSVAGGPAEQACDSAVIAAFDDAAALDEFTAQVQVATYEFENVPTDTASRLADRIPVFPPPSLLFVSQQRIREKDAARRLGLKTTPYREASSPEGAVAAFQMLGAGILKTVSGGYDGKGQFLVSDVEEAARGFTQLYRGGSLIYEQKVDFRQEISVVVARDQGGQIETFPVSENHHHAGILDWTLVPARIAPDTASAALAHARTMAEGLGLVGVMALEYFVTTEGEVLFNEMAPRPHNSGHWTIEGAWPSQFEQHMRAVAGWPVAPVRQLSPTVMVNLMGEMFMAGRGALVKVQGLDGVQLHWYGKEDMRPGRKVGHLTIVQPTVGQALAQARQAKVLAGGEWFDGA
jgi:5-(carboxyamino)imidazole ribonucleotide synthase